MKTASVASALSSFWRRGRPVERAGYLVGTLLLASGVAHLAILLLSDGSWDGPLSLRKAATFGLSFGLTVITIVWVSAFLRIGERLRTVLLGAFTVASVVETALVSLQAWRGVPSHFNMETTFDGLVAGTLAVGGMVLVAIIGALLFLSFRRQPSSPFSLLIAIRFGLATLFSSMVVGGMMIARGVMLVVGGNPQAAYMTGGTLKPTHAVTMHAVLVLPLLAWLLSFTDWPEERRVRLVSMSAIGYAVLAVIVAIVNLVGLD